MNKINNFCTNIGNIKYNHIDHLQYTEKGDTFFY